jgi:hypothetical protein
MHQLEFVAATGDGSHLLLVGEDGSEYRVKVDDRLRNALDPTPAGAPLQMRLPVDGPLTPRDVQHRLRHGTELAELAAEAGMPLDRLEAYATPVLAERNYVAELAQGCGVDSGGTLAESVLHRLAARGVTEEPSWDAWREPDGRWRVMVRYASDLASVSQSEESASWLFDVPIRTLEADDDAARWLTDAPAVEAVQVASTAVNPDWDQAHPAARAARARAEAEAAAQSEKQGPDDMGPGAEDAGARADGVAVNPNPNGPGGKPLSRRAARRLAARRRTTRKEDVPSWDEILFGSGRPDASTENGPRGPSGS